MGLKLSDLNPNEVEFVGQPSDGLKLSDLHPSEVEFINEPEDPAKSPVTAATTGAIQGAIPFASAFAGAGKAATNAITGVTGPLGGGSFGDILDDYRRERDAFSKDARTAAQANPKVAFAGSLGGGFANPLFKGVDSLPKAMGAGAIQGTGLSDADLTKGEVPRAATDAGIGAAGGALGYGASKAIPKILGGIGSLGKKALTTLGPSEEAINARLAGKAQPNAASYPELAEEMGGTLGKLGDQIKEADTAAWNTLSNEPAIPREYLTGAIDDAIKELQIKDGRTLGSASKQASGILNSIKSDVQALTTPIGVAQSETPASAQGSFENIAFPKEPQLQPRNLSESELRSVIQKLDENIDWDDQSQNTTNQALESVRSRLDSMLKFRNQEYRKAMEPVADRTGLHSALKRQFNFIKSPGEGLQPTDTTATKVQTALRENKAVTQENLERLKSLTGKDYAGLARDYQLSQQFENTAPNGSRRTNLAATVMGGLGAAGGALVGGIPGAAGGGALGGAAGAITGATLDRYGGKLLGRLIDTYLKAGNSAAFGKFEPVILKAAQNGPQALAVTGAVLSSNPEFRKIMGIDNVGR